MVSELNFLVEPLVPALLQLMTRSTESNNIVLLGRIHRPLPHVDSLVLHPGTVGTLTDRNSHSVCWNVKYSFWLAVHSVEATFLNQVKAAFFSACLCLFFFLFFFSSSFDTSYCHHTDQSEYRGWS